MGSINENRRGRHVWLVVAIMAVVVIVDQLVKQWMLRILEPGEPVEIIPGFFRLLLVFNPGAAFGMGENATWLFTSIQLIFAVGILVASPFIKDRWTAVGLALVGGGAAGNLMDRLFREPGFWFGHVVDYLSFGNFAIFNIADACITVGVVVFLIAMFMEDRREAQTQAEERVSHD